MRNISGDYEIQNDWIATKTRSLSFYLVGNKLQENFFFITSYYSIFLSFAFSHAWILPWSVKFNKSIPVTTYFIPTSLCLLLKYISNFCLAANLRRGKLDQQWLSNNGGRCSQTNTSSKVVEASLVGDILLYQGTKAWNGRCAVSGDSYHQRALSYTVKSWRSRLVPVHLGRGTASFRIESILPEVNVAWMVDAILQDMEERRVCLHATRKPFRSWQRQNLDMIVQVDPQDIGNMVERLL